MLQCLGFLVVSYRVIWHARCPFPQYTASPCGLASFPRKRESRRRGAWELDARLRGHPVLLVANLRNRHVVFRFWGIRLMPLRDWIDRYPGVKRLMEQPEDILEGVSVERSEIPRHIYTMEHCAGETIRVGERVSFDNDHAIRWLPGDTLVGIALTHAEPGETVRIQVSEVYFAH